MYFENSPIPRISISPAPPEDPVIEPYSPFAAIALPRLVDDGFRPLHLTPPPTTLHFKSPFERKVNDEETGGNGLDSGRFQQMLNATRERNASVGLRKELAIKIQKNKQAERRAFFLSKVQAPPSPTATLTPKTPPESPAVFHYTMPSPGLVSPLALFETVDKTSCKAWVEQVDFNNPAGMKPVPAKRRPLPSLEQISARLIPSTIKPNDYDADGPLSALDATISSTTTPNSRPLIGIGRLRMPLRASQPQPQSPQKPANRSLVVTKTSYTASTTQLTETNLNAFNLRGQRAADMLCTLRKRTPSLSTKFHQPRSPGVVDDDETRIRRHSAPADMTARPRFGFEHSVLALPGGF